MTASVASIRLGTQRGTGLLPDSSRPLRPFFANNGTTWTRPADWLAMPALTPDVDRKIHVLAAVYNNGSNLYAVNCTTSSGTYTVDWGDGLGTQTYTSGTTASYNILYANIGAGTLTTRGYRQAMITITPTTSGQSLTAALFNVRGTNDTSTSGNPHNILEVSACDVGLARITFGVESTSIATAAYNPNLEQVNLVQTAATIRAAASGQNFDYMFSHCYSLQSVTGTVTGAASGTYSATGMFFNCRTLRRAPTLNMQRCTFAVDMFANCASLQEVNLDNVSSVSAVANWGQTFQNCTSLQNAPRFPNDGANCESWSSTFSGCNSLKNVPYINATRTSISFFNNMFQNCQSLRNAPVIDFPGSTASFACTSMFSGCNSLESAPTYNMTRCNNTQNMFSGCSNLKKYGNMTFAVNSSCSAMFANCASLVSVGNINLGGVVNNTGNMFLACARLESVGTISGAGVLNSMSNMFANCYSLQVGPAMTLSAANLNMANMFQNCFSMTAGPAITSAGTITTTASMFLNCVNLNTVPNYSWNYAAGSGNTSNMFDGCRSLVVAPALNLAQVTNASGMFNGCHGLIAGGSWTTTSLTNASNMFNSCTALQIAPTFTATAQITNVQGMFQFSGLVEFPAYNFVGVTSGGNLSGFVGGPNVSRVQATGLRFSISFGQCRLAGAQLDEIYTNLPTITAQTVTVTGNWGTATDTPTIATAKGWTVTGS